MASPAAVGLPFWLFPLVGEPPLLGELLSPWLESRSVSDGEPVWIIGLVGPWDPVEGTLG